MAVSERDLLALFFSLAHRLVARFVSGLPVLKMIKQYH